jgi:ribonuclease HI
VGSSPTTATKYEAKEGKVVTTTFKVYTDASSRYKAVMAGAKGDKRGKRVHPSSIGAVIKDGCEIVGSISKRVGFQDSNYAEFLAMYMACRYLIDHGIKKVDFYADCINLVLMVNQKVISGKPQLRKLSYAILDCLKQFESYTITWIPRSSNKEAHTMASKAFKVS